MAICSNVLDHTLQELISVVITLWRTSLDRLLVIFVLGFKHLYLEGMIDIISKDASIYKLLSK